MNPRAEFIKESYSESPTFRTRTDFGQRFDAFQRKHPEFFSNDPREISKYGLYELWRTQRTQTLPQREEVNTIFARRLEFEVVQRQEYDRWRDKTWMMNIRIPQVVADVRQQRRGEPLKRCSSKLRDDEEVVHTVVTQIEKQLQYASER